METVSRISSMLETARELTLEAAQSASNSKLYRSGGSPRNSAQIKKLLDSRVDREILDGLRKVVSLMYRSESCAPFFSSVVKNVASPNVEIKKLVYIYLLKYAEEEPDLALLSINAIQKSLTDQNPQVRAMALRTMSGIRVPVISQIVSLAIKRGCGDMSPHVRKAAALAIPKCYRLDPNTMPQLTDYLSTLLGDTQYFVVGPAVASFTEVCPDRLDLIHKHYRSIVRKLVDMDEWGQLATLRLMTIYARKCFSRRTERVKKSASKGFYDEVESSDDGDNDEVLDILVMDSDLDLLLKACKLLLQSRNSAVIVDTVRCFRYLGTIEQLQLTVGPLIALLRCSQDIQHVALYNIIAVALLIPKTFTKYASHFLVRSTDQEQIKILKMEILTILYPYFGLHMKGVILSELEHFSNGFDLALVRESVRAIGRCAESDPSVSDKCLQILLRQLSSAHDNLVSEALTVVRHLVQQNPASHTSTVVMLAKRLGITTSPEARATIIWLVGEFAGIDFENNIAPDVLRILAQGFADESETAKQQIVLLGAKVYLHHLLNKPQESAESHVQEDPSDNADPQPPKEDTITTLWRYILLLARYDTSYDLRDRARLYKALLVDPTSTQLASLILLAPKPVPHAPSPSELRKGLLLGTSTLVIGPDAGMHGLRGYQALPDWVAAGEEPDPTLRDEEVTDAGVGKGFVTAGERLDKALKDHDAAAAAGAGASSSSAVAAGRNKYVSLDEWLDESEEGEETTEEESTEEESSEEDGDEYETDEVDDDDSGQAQAGSSREKVALMA
ncbi:AP-3 complex subunit beta [Ophidiomyces ophidiicola]|nr:AP-3 complex subunit beta [Ophidiomyces ophidiicola]